AGHRQTQRSQNDYAVTYTSTQICAVKGSTVDIGCSFKHPSRVNVLKRVWFTKGNNYNPEDLKTDPAYAGRVSYSSHWKSCTLTIRDLRESDSAVYKFRFETDWKDFTGLPGVTLTVTGNIFNYTSVRNCYEHDCVCLDMDNGCLRFCSDFISSHNQFFRYT
uniref:Immunoglobulin domain-containing protein n=1 Tax=Maylandia zebra TaxID=106582 RepID=A0A3P9CBI8_9CICH